MHKTIFCTFKRNVGWRVHSVVAVETNCISIIVKDGIKMLAIPVVGKITRGQFCNPAKLLMAVVRQIKQPVVFVNQMTLNEPDPLTVHYERQSVIVLSPPPLSRANMMTLH